MREVLAWALDPDAAYRTDILPRKLAYYRALVRGGTFGGDIAFNLATRAALLSRDSQLAGRCLVCPALWSVWTKCGNMQAGNQGNTRNYGVTPCRFGKLSELRFRTMAGCR